MKIYKEVLKNNIFHYKGYDAIFTSKGNTKNVLNIIKEVEPREFKAYGLNDKGDFIIPIFEKLIEKTEDVFVLEEDINYFEFEYYGKFELDLEKIYKVCEEKNIPILIETRPEL